MGSPEYHDACKKLQDAAIEFADWYTDRDATNDAVAVHMHTLYDRAREFSKVYDLDKKKVQGTKPFVLRAMDAKVGMMLVDYRGTPCKVEEVTEHRIFTRRYENMSPWPGPPAEWTYEQFNSYDFRVVKPGDGE